MGYFQKVKAKNKQGYKWKYTEEGPKDPVSGKRRQLTRRADTKKEAKKKAEQAIKGIKDNMGMSLDRNITFQEFSAAWFGSYKKRNKVSTVNVRRKNLKHLNHYLGPSKLESITLDQYQHMLDNLFEKNYAVNTISNIHACASMIFKEAMKKNKILKDPTQFAEMPKKQETVEEIESQEVKELYLEKEELAGFLQAAKVWGLERDYIIFLTLAYTGLRAGELVVLKWKDIDFEKQEISVTKTLYNPNNNTVKYRLVPPKNKGSIRTIGIDEIVLKELEKHQTQQNKLKMQYRDFYYDQGFVFAKSGEYMGYPDFIKTIENRMRRLLKKMGEKEYLTPHSFRHTHTSLLAEAGVSLPEIMERLGHVDDDTTTQVYLHVTKSRKKEASQKFGELMRGIHQL
ncbi:site-specific integrase [Lentibacillus kapialis]|uniref:Site-specific integrase n=1 Tax=Lentibacillus kapialis TaxID=340214 RepID=A0A917PZ77_9BACI|nr:site-specific integrase [Lentibacillus kapialis]GGK00765.1 site-specific integrase [Lentibacillus kapialis]